MPNGEAMTVRTAHGWQLFLTVVAMSAAFFAWYTNQTAAKTADTAVEAHDKAPTVHVVATSVHNDREDSHYGQNRVMENRVDKQEQAIIKIEGHIERLTDIAADQKIDMRAMQEGQQKILLYIKSIAPPED